MYSSVQTERVLNAVGIDTNYETAEHWLIFCPYHNNWRTPAAEVDKELGLFYCFSCGASANLQDLVMKISGRKYYEALRLISDKEVKTSLVKNIDDALGKADIVEFDQELLGRLHDSAVGMEKPSNYLVYRNINENSVDKFKIGYSENQDMITVPVHSTDGVAMGFVGRSIEGKSFKNSKGLQKSKTLFNVHRVKASPYVFIVESSFDAIRLDQAGVPAVASLGSSVSSSQAKLLDKYFNVVYIVPDADEAGEEMVAKLQKTLGEKVIRLNLPEGVKDVGDLSNEQIEKLRVHVDNPLLGIL